MSRKLIALLISVIMVSANIVFADTSNYTIIGDSTVFKPMINEISKLRYYLDGAEPESVTWSMNKETANTFMTQDGYMRLDKLSATGEYTITATYNSAKYTKTVKVENGKNFDFDNVKYGDAAHLKTDSTGNVYYDPNVRVDVPLGTIATINLDAIVISFDFLLQRNVSFSLNRATVPKADGSPDTGAWWYSIDSKLEGSFGSFTMTSNALTLHTTPTIYPVNEYARFKMLISPLRRTATVYINDQLIMEEKALYEKLSDITPFCFITYGPVDNIVMYSGKPVEQQVDITNSRYMPIAEQGSTSSLKLNATVKEGGVVSEKVKPNWTLDGDYPGIRIEGDKVIADSTASGAFSVVATLPVTGLTQTAQITLSKPDVFFTSSDDKLFIKGPANQSVDLVIFKPKNESDAVSSFLGASDKEDLINGGTSIEHQLQLDMNGNATFDLSQLNHGTYKVYGSSQGGVENYIDLTIGFDTLFGENLLTTMNSPYFKDFLTKYTDLPKQDVESAIDEYKSVQQKPMIARIMGSTLKDFPLAVYLAKMMELTEYDSAFMKVLSEKLQSNGFDSTGLLLLEKNLSYIVVVEKVASENFEGISSFLETQKMDSILIGLAKLPHVKDGKVFLAAINNSKYNNAGEKQNYIAEQIGNKTYASIDKVHEAINKLDFSEADEDDKSNGKTSRPSTSGKIGGGTVLPTPTTTPNVDNGNKTEKTKYKDVLIDHWAYESIENLSEKGIVQGLGDEFKPDAYITRAEFVKILVLAFNIDADAVSDFHDVSNNQWYYDFIGKAQQTGLVQGDAGYFYPNERIKREDMAVMVYRFAKYAGVNYTGTHYFNDEDIVSDYAKEAVNLMGANGVINGMDGNLFVPSQNATRAQAAQIVYKILNRR